MVDEFDDVEEVELVEDAEDNARDLTSGLVISTFVVTLIALVVMMWACGTWFAVGPFA